MGSVIVAGGGASGLVAAIFAARHGADVTILEHKDIVGKKILATGNGKCNLTNMDGFKGKYYSSDLSSLDKVYAILDRFDADKTRKFFEGIGLYTKQLRDGGVYPVSEQAAIVAQVLESECRALGVRIETNCDVKSIVGNEVSFIRYAPNDKSKGVREHLGYDRLILSMGGKACKSTGSDGSGYYFARTIGHEIIEPLPALVQLRCNGDYFKDLAGVRTKAKIALYVDGEKTAADEGELQLTDYGISGIPVFGISSPASRALYRKSKCEVVIDFLPFMKEMPPVSNFEKKTVRELISGMVHSKIAAYICAKNNINPCQKVSETDKEKIMAIINLLHGFSVNVTGTNPFDNAQVCSGGVALSEVDDNLMSLKNKNVYITGELLDCDGVCGGYNLQWAWASGAVAGNAAGGYR